MTKAIAEMKRGGTQKQRGSSLAELLGPPPLVPGEDVAKFEELEARVLAAIRPRDAIEEILARDIADLTWEIVRGRRLKASLLLACAPAGLKRVLTPLIGRAEAGELSEAWAKGGIDAKAKVARHLAAAHLHYRCDHGGDADGEARSN